jgi:hypothetical protein
MARYRVSVTRTVVAVYDVEAGDKDGAINEGLARFHAEYPDGDLDCVAGLDGRGHEYDVDDVDDEDEDE